MRRGSLFLRLFLVACATGAGVGVAAWGWHLLALGPDAPPGGNADRILSLALGTGILAATLFLVLSDLLMQRHLREPISRLIGYARQILEGRYEAVPITGKGEIRVLSEAFHRMAEAIRERDKSLTQLATFTAANPNLVMKVNREGRILYANHGAERTLYEMGLPPQHGELLLPEETGSIIREFLASKEKTREFLWTVEGRTIRYTIFGFEGEEAVVFHGEDITAQIAREADRIEAPACEPADPGTGTSAEPFSPMDPFPHRGGTVLVVDDEELLRDVAAAMLVSLGFETLTAPDGNEGVKIFRRERSRILFTILDLRMPVMDGTEAFEEIRKIDPEARIVISTGFSREEDVRRLKEQGAAAVLSKPYTYGQIARVAGLFQSPTRSPAPVETP